MTVSSFKPHLSDLVEQFHLIRSHIVNRMRPYPMMVYTELYFKAVMLAVSSIRTSEYMMLFQAVLSIVVSIQDFTQIATSVRIVMNYRAAHISSDSYSVSSLSLNFRYPSFSLIR